MLMRHFPSPLGGALEMQTVTTARRLSSAWARSPGVALGRAAAAWRGEEAGAPDKTALRARLWADEAETSRANMFTLKTTGGIALSGKSAEERVQLDASALVIACRAPGARGATSPVQALLHEYSLSSHEGVTLLGLAEALLRINSAEGRSRLIADKLAAVRAGGNGVVGNGKAASWTAGHIGLEKPLVVNAAATALATGEAVVGARANLTSHLGMTIGTPFAELVLRLGEPAIRVVVTALMRKLGDEFVLGETIERAIRRGNADAVTHASTSPSLPRQMSFSFDMLGEAARTQKDADAYWESYAHAIKTVGASAALGSSGELKPGVSVKLSALDPRFEPSHRAALLGHVQPLGVAGVRGSLVDSVSQLAALAADAGVDLTIDAEEASRLELQLDIISAVSSKLSRSHPGWDGLGMAVQTYQRRASAVVDWLADVARRDSRKFKMRLVKGAYWDSEMKVAQGLGLPTFPVYTRKEATDVCYHACIAKVLHEHADAITPAFATHNARTLSVVAALARARGWSPLGQEGEGVPLDFEIQRLHGMGQDLHDAATGVGGCLAGVPVRIYAPVGNHDQLLAYLVRRLLENGANSSFVNALADKKVDVAQLVADPALVLEHVHNFTSHPKIAPPRELFSFDPVKNVKAHGLRKNSEGYELGYDITAMEKFAEGMAAVDFTAPRKTPATTPLAVLSAWRSVVPTSRAAALARGGSGAEIQAVVDPTTGTAAGAVSPATPIDIECALEAATAAQPGWDALGASARAGVLRRAADAFEAHCAPLCALLVSEAGKTVPDAISEVREAVDFLRYYANDAEIALAPTVLRGPVGERNEMHFRGRGVWASIAPWNFPLAIYIGQAAAALAAGNAVLAKSAPQTPLCAAAAVALLHGAGVPKAVLAHLPGGAKVGAALVNDQRVDGVVFTGSGEAARAIFRQLAARPVDSALAPLLAETAGLNALIADESALPEQLVSDAVRSAFGAAGQRCSSARLLCVPMESSQTVVDMLIGAMAELSVADPAYLDTDVGPLIDTASVERVQAHVDALMQVAGVKLLGRAALPLPAVSAPQQPAGGGLALPPLPADARPSFFAPVLLEIPSLSALPRRECFGPVLHVLRYDSRPVDSLEKLIRDINKLGYGLTMGLHSRLDSAHATARSSTAAGNLYINRDTIGAVVESQPFGGSRLSGTGPKVHF